MNSASSKEEKEEEEEEEDRLDRIRVRNSMQIRRLARFGVTGSPMTTKNSPASRLVSSLFSGDLRFLSVPAFSFRALLSDGPRDFTFKSYNRVFPATEGARENETRRDESRAAAAAISAFSLPC